MHPHQPAWLLSPISPHSGVLTLTLLPACRSETLALATLAWPSECCFCCFGLLACILTPNVDVLPQCPGGLPARLEVHPPAACCRLMRDKHGGELVAVKFIERGEKVGATNALLQWAGSA